MEIKVSVLVYVLNGISYADRCLRSVMGQTLGEIEILVIDGGSTDGTLELAEELARKDPRIRIIHSGPGVGRQFNTGLREACGEYIGICESDDFLLPDMYERQYRIAREFDLDMLRADAWHFFGPEGRESFLPAVLSKQQELYGRVLDLREDTRVVSLGINSFWSGIYRRQFLLEQGIMMNETGGASYQDVTFSFLTVVKAGRAMLSREAFYCYRLDNSGSSVNSPRGMDLLGREYRLLKERLGAEGLFSRYRGIYLGWKVDSCLGFYDSFPEGQREAYVPVMCQDIKEDLDSGILQEEVPGAAQREMVLLAGQSADALGLRLRRTYDVYRQMKQKMESIEKERSVVVFGKGDLGRLAGLYLVGRGRNIAAYIDNGAAAYLEQDTGRNTGTERNNIRGNFLFLPAPGVREDSSSGQKQEGLRIPLFAPERGASMYPDGVYVLASEAGHEDMKRQLLGLGISEENIISWGSYGYFLKHVLIESEKACRQEER